MWGRYGYLYLKDLVLKTLQGDIRRKSQSSAFHDPGCLGDAQELSHEKCSCPRVEESMERVHKAHDRYRKTTRGRGLHRMISRWGKR